MSSWENVLKFCGKEELGLVNTLLRDTFREFLDERFCSGEGAAHEKKGAGRFKQDLATRGPRRLLYRAKD